MSESPVLPPRELWRDRVLRQSQSALTIEKFCHQEGVPVSSFYQWKRKLNEHDHTTSSPKFLPVAIKTPSAPALKQNAEPIVTLPITITLLGGVMVQVPQASSRENLVQLLAACVEAVR